ncbi:hypothetical protein ACX0G7_08080 [Flavitalea antarctica]
MENDQLYKFRQPLVTAAGIILGFVLNFASEVVRLDRKNTLLALLIILPILIGISLLVVALYRILDNEYDRDHANKFYRKTLNYFIYGVIFSFAGGLLKMIQVLFFL